MSKILVACPNNEVKEYAFQRWIDNVKSLTYPDYDILVVDNSPTEDFINKYKEQVPMERIDTAGIEDLMICRINRSMERIRERFLVGDYQWWMNIESDVIPQTDVIEVLLKWGRDSDWVSHAYPARDGNDALAQQGIGCSLLSRRLIEKFGFADAEDQTTPDGYLWNLVRPHASEYPTMELWGYLTIKHLRE